jgi:hypothetical protein
VDPRTSLKAVEWKNCLASVGNREGDILHLCMLTNLKERLLMNVGVYHFQSSITYDSVFVFFWNYIILLKKVGINYIYIVLYLFMGYTVLLLLSYGTFIST